jgi:glycosyltransferase involved in cell wall biosynthesis
MSALPPVAIVSHFPPPPGGMPDLAELLVRRLSAEGATALRVRTNLGPGRIGQRLDRVRGLRTVLRIPVYLARLIRTIPRVRVIHILSHSGLAFFVFTGPAVLLGRLAGRRVIVNYHGGGAEPFLARFGRLALPILRRASVVAVPSGFVGGVVERYGIPTQTLANPCDVDAFPWHGDEPRRPVIIVARHLEPIYNVACALRAFALVHADVPAAKLIVLGGGSQAKSLATLADELGIAEAVEFTGYVPHDAIVGQYARASWFLNTSDVDNVPMSILEAYASGLPVVSTRAGGIPFLVAHGETGMLVDLDDHVAAAADLLALMREPARAHDMAARARDAVRDRNSWAAVRRQLGRLYRPEAA